MKTLTENSKVSKKEQLEMAVKKETPNVNLRWIAAYGCNEAKKKLLLRDDFAYKRDDEYDAREDSHSIARDDLDVRTVLGRNADLEMQIELSKYTEANTILISLLAKTYNKEVCLNLLNNPNHTVRMYYIGFCKMPIEMYELIKDIESTELRAIFYSRQDIPKKFIKEGMTDRNIRDFEEISYLVDDVEEGFLTNFKRYYEGLNNEYKNLEPLMKYLGPKQAEAINYLSEVLEHDGVDDKTLIKLLKDNNYALEQLRGTELEDEIKARKDFKNHFSKKVPEFQNAMSVNSLIVNSSSPEQFEERESQLLAQIEQLKNEVKYLKKQLSKK